MLNFAFLGGVRSDLAFGAGEARGAEAGDSCDSNDKLNG